MPNLATVCFRCIFGCFARLQMPHAMSQGGCSQPCPVPGRCEQSGPRFPPLVVMHDELSVGCWIPVGGSSVGNVGYSVIECTRE